MIASIWFDWEAYRQALVWLNDALEPTRNFLLWLVPIMNQVTFWLLVPFFVLLLLSLVMGQAETLKQIFVEVSEKAAKRAAADAAITPPVTEQAPNKSKVSRTKQSEVLRANNYSNR